MNKLQINLSSRPFTNHTLYHLAYAVIGLAALLLMAHNLLWFFNNHGDVRLMENEIDQLQTEVDRNIRETRALSDEIEQIQRNRRFREVVSFVDSRIRQRRFSWIRMINLLQEALPPDVKIESITPRVQPESIRITLACMARKTAAVNEFIENLEDIEEFDRVLITSEDREGGTVSFPLTMEYSPTGFDRSARASAGVTPEGTETEVPEPGSVAEWVSREAVLPDPDAADWAEASPGDAGQDADAFPELKMAPDDEIFDPFAPAGDDPFVPTGEDPFGGGGMFGDEPPPGGPPPDAGAPNQRSDDSNRTPPRGPGRQPGDRS